MVGIRLVLDRFCPSRKTMPIHIELPSLHDAGGIAEAQQEVPPQINQSVSRRPLSVGYANQPCRKLEVRLSSGSFGGGNLGWPV